MTWLVADQFYPEIHLLVVEGPLNPILVVSLLFVNSCNESGVGWDKVKSGLQGCFLAVLLNVSGTSQCTCTCICFVDVTQSARPRVIYCSSLTGGLRARWLGGFVFSPFLLMYQCNVMTLENQTSEE